MTSPGSLRPIHSPSIPTPTESDSSFVTSRAPTDRQIVPRSRTLAPVEPIEEMEEKETMSTNAQILTNPTLEQCFFQAVQAVIDRALSIDLTLHAGRFGRRVILSF